jgi:hypothetical protein
MDIHNMNDTQFCEYKTKIRQEIEAKNNWDKKDIITMLLSYSQTANGQRTRIDIEDRDNLIVPIAPLNTAILDKRVPEKLTYKLMALRINIKEKGYTSVMHIHQFLNK